MRTFATGLLIAGLGSAPLSYAQEAEGLLKKEGCLKCHAVSSEKDGPSYKSVAAKYKGKADGAATIQGELKNGKIKDGKEPKHATFKGSDAELKAVVDYILSR